MKIIGCDGDEFEVPELSSLSLLKKTIEQITGKKSHTIKLFASEGHTAVVEEDLSGISGPLYMLYDGVYKPIEGNGVFRGLVYRWTDSWLTDKTELTDIVDTYGSIEAWNTNKVTNMSGIFYKKREFNEDISQWDTSNVELMESMFEGSMSFNQNIGGWNISKVKNMSHMFFNAMYFNQDLSEWDVSKVETMECMLYNARQFRQDLSNWSTKISNVKNMDYLFADTKQMSCDIQTWNWDLSGVETKSEMFRGCDTPTTRAISYGLRGLGIRM